MAEPWASALRHLHAGTHAVLYHHGPEFAHRVAARFAADGLSWGQAVVVAAEAAEVERIVVLLAGAGVDVEKEHEANRLLLVQSDAKQVERLAYDLRYLLAWIDDQARGTSVRVWNHWAGVLAEAGRFEDAKTLEWRLAELHGNALVLCHHDVEKFGANATPGNLEGLASLHDALLAQLEGESLEFRDRRAILA